MGGAVHAVTLHIIGGVMSVIENQMKTATHALLAAHKPCVIKLSDIVQ